MSCWCCWRPEMLVRVELLILVFLLFISSISVPTLAESVCGVSVDGLQYPSEADAGSNFKINAAVSISCVKAGNYLSGYATLVDLASNTAIDSRSFPLRVIPFSTPTEITTVVSLTVKTAPDNDELWVLRFLVEIYGYSDRTLIASAQRDFTIHVTDLREALTDLSVLQNGGFESNFASWQKIQNQDGYVTLSSLVVRSGSSALAINAFPPKPGNNPLVPIVLGVSQTATVSKLRGLRVESWYLLQTTSYLSEVRLRVVIGEFTLNYHVKTGPFTQAVQSNNPRERSIAISPARCDPWCLLQVDVESDVRTLFDSVAFGSVFRSIQSIPITIALEFLISNSGNNQFLFWDDATATASVPLEINPQQATPPSSTVSSDFTIQGVTSTDISRAKNSPFEIVFMSTFLSVGWHQWYRAKNVLAHQGAASSVIEPDIHPKI